MHCLLPSWLKTVWPGNGASSTVHHKSTRNYKDACNMDPFKRLRSRLYAAAGRSGSLEAEEEEYAWLAPGCLKPFVQGDGADSNPSTGLQADPNLQACIAAADRAVSAQRPASASASADPRQSGDEDADPEASGWPNAETDSDGGGFLSFPRKVTQLQFFAFVGYRPAGDLALPELCCGLGSLRQVQPY